MNNLSILLVDDDFINRKLIRTFLKRYPELIGKVYEAKDGSEALEVARRHPDINLILLDILMPVLNGKEFLKIFRSEKENSRIPVIVLTTDDTERAAAMDSGADDFLIKPIKEEELMKHIRYWTQG